MKKKMIVVTLISFILLLVCGTSYYFTHNSVLFSLAITFGTCFYHLAIRLIIGLGMNSIFHNKMNYNKWWFKERKFESKLYSFLQVKKWKKHLPTFDSKTFDIKEHSFEEILQATCQSEIVHEINMVLSFVPIIFTIWFGSLAAFIITSILAFCFDSLFVIIQRYNRPRLRRLLRK